MFCCRFEALSKDNWPVSLDWVFWEALIPLWFEDVVLTSTSFLSSSFHSSVEAISVSFHWVWHVTHSSNSLVANNKVFFVCVDYDFQLWPSTIYIKILSRTQNYGPTSVCNIQIAMEEDPVIILKTEVWKWQRRFTILFH